MKILCAYSGIQFNCEHFPGSLTAREACHPIFHIPQKKLLSYLGKWGAQELTPTDSYLLFLSILKSTDLVDFRVPAIRIDQTDSIIAQNMEALCKIVSRLNTIVNPAVLFPHYVISPETKNLATVHHWIYNWKEIYEDFLSGKSRDYEVKKLVQRESALERLIKNPHKPVSAYSTQIGDWAALAGSFPVFNLKSPFTGLTVTCADYWKAIINKCAREESIFAIPRKDIEELLEHCEEHISVGTIYSNALFKILRHALERQKNFLGLGDLDISSSTYKILEEDDSVESANIMAMIQSAPQDIPRPEQYPNKLAYLKAKMKYEMSLKYAKPDPEELELNQLRRHDDL